MCETHVDVPAGDLRDPDVIFHSVSPQPDARPVRGMPSMQEDKTHTAKQRTAAVTRVTSSARRLFRTPCLTRASGAVLMRWEVTQARRPRESSWTLLGALNRLPSAEQRITAARAKHYC